MLGWWNDRQQRPRWTNDLPSHTNRAGCHWAGCAGAIACGRAGEDRWGNDDEFEGHACGGQSFRYPFQWPTRCGDFHRVEERAKCVADYGPGHHNELCGRVGELECVCWRVRLRSELSILMEHLPSFFSCRCSCLFSVLRCNGFPKMWSSGLFNEN